jgi:hypothetical protein
VKSAQIGESSIELHPLTRIAGEAWQARLSAIQPSRRYWPGHPMLVCSAHDITLSLPPTGLSHGPARRGSHPCGLHAFCCEWSPHATGVSSCQIRASNKHGGHTEPAVATIGLPARAFGHVGDTILLLVDSCVFRGATGHQYFARHALCAAVPVCLPWIAGYAEVGSHVVKVYFNFVPLPPPGLFMLVPACNVPSPSVGEGEDAS